jgi:transketolase
MKPIAMRDAFLERIWLEMAKDVDIFFISADFGSPVLDKIRNDYPKRFVNVGIAEQNLINVTAGLALEGFKVFAYAIAPFITMRCYEQLRVNLALLSEVRPMNVTLIGVGAGYSYVVSGPTHQCYEDLTLMRALPNVRVYSTPDHVATAALFEACLIKPGIKYLRLDAQILPVVYENNNLQLNDGYQVHREGADYCLVATGFMLHTALKISEQLAEVGVEVGVIDLIDISQLHERFISIISKYKGLVTMEEGFSGRGGMDALLFDAAARNQLKTSILNIGVEPGYRFELGTRDELHEQVGIGVDAAKAKILQFIQNLTK